MRINSKCKDQKCIFIFFFLLLSLLLLLYVRKLLHEKKGVVILGYLLYNVFWCKMLNVLKTEASIHYTKLKTWIKQNPELG